MQTAAPITGAPPQTEREQSALLKLLGDDDPQVFSAVRAKLLSHGDSVCRWLRPHRLSSDPLVRRRVCGIILHFERRETDREFLSYCLHHGGDLDLETGALLLARTTYPEINTDAYRALLDEMAEDIRPHLEGVSRPREQLAAINHRLFTKLGFRGDDKTYFDPKNSYLNQTLDRRTGNPISLCTVYMLLARRLELPIAGIGLPGHFLCRCQTAAESIYIDPFGGGRLLTKADCVQHLLHSAFGLREQFLTPVSPRRMLMRMCGNLQQSCLHSGLTVEASRMKGYLMALTRPND